MRMEKLQKRIWLGICAALVAGAVPARAQVEQVDPTIGNVGILLVPTRPAVYLPNSMVRVYPMREDAMDDRIQSFPLTISSHRISELFSIMPGDGRAAAYDQETTTPYYYAMRFADSGIGTEFTAAERCGFFRFTFPDEKAALVLANRIAGTLEAHGDVVQGEEHFDGMKAFVYGVFSVPVEAKTARDGEKDRVAITAHAGTLEFRYGISFISVGQAKKNLEGEIAQADFDAIEGKGEGAMERDAGTDRG